MANEVEIRIAAKNLSSKALKEIHKDLDATAKKLIKAAEEAKRFGAKGESALAKLRRSVKGIDADFRALAVSAGVISAGLGLMIKSVIGASVKFDNLKRSLASVAGSSKETARQLKQLEAVARLPGIGLEEAIRGSVNLQAVEMSAEMAARSLKAYGNALATVGSGKAELGGVILALTQMSAKGKVLSEEINQIAERVPQIRKAMMDAFGTATSEQIQKMGITTKQFMEGILTELEKLPSVAGGAQNSLENLSDSIEEVKVMFGDVLLPTFIKIIGKVSELVEWISKLSDTQKEMIAWGTVGGAAITGLVAAIAGIGIAIPGVISAIKALGVAVTFLSAHPLILAATAVAALVVGIGLYVAATRKAKVTAESFSQRMEEIAQSVEKTANIEKLVDRLDELRKKTDLTEKESRDLVDVQNELAQLAPTLVAKYTNEGNAIIKATDATREYVKALEKLNKEERELEIRRAKRRLPELEKGLEAIREEKRVIREMQKATESGQAKTASFFDMVRSEMEGTKKVYGDLEAAEARVIKQEKDALREIARLQQLIQQGVAPKPPAGDDKPRTFAIPDTKEADKVFQAWAAMEHARIALIQDSYQREREEAILANKIIIHGIQKQLKEKKIQTERASHLNTQLALESQKLVQKLAAIDRRFAQERNERISKDILTERQFYEMSVQAAEEAARRKKEIAEQLYADELDLSIRMAHAKIENAERTRKMIAEGAQKAILEQKRFEASVEKAKGLIPPITKLELDTSAIQAFSREIAALPFDFIRVLKQRHDLGKQLNEDLIRLEQEKNDRIKEIRRDDTLSVRERAREIERIEKESAERRANIERDLMERKKALFGDYLKNFAAGIARQIELILQRKAAEKITEFALGKLGGTAATGLTMGSLARGASASLAFRTAIPYVGMALIGAKVLGFDNPVHDRLAQLSGGNAAMLMGASFDDPYNDMKAKLQGTYAASRDLGRRSAEDMLQNFQAGFIQRSQTVAGGSGGDAEGVRREASNRTADDNLAGVLQRIEKRLGDNPQFQLFIDGRPLHAVLKKIDDAATFRERAT